MPGTNLWPIHVLLGVQSILIVLVSLNRLTKLVLGYVSANEFLRWVDLNNMLVLPLISVAAAYLLKKEIERGVPAGGQGSRLALNLMFIAGVYNLAAGYGDHELANYLHARFCAGKQLLDDALCRIVVFNDDEFSHWVFFGGYILINASLLLFQSIFANRRILTFADLALLALNGLFIALGIFANLAFETIGLDLYVVALLALLAFWLLWRQGARPLFVYYSTAYGLGLIATAVYKTLQL